MTCNALKALMLPSLSCIKGAPRFGGLWRSQTSSSLLQTGWKATDCVLLNQWRAHWRKIVKEEEIGRQCIRNLVPGGPLLLYTLQSPRAGELRSALIFPRREEMETPRTKYVAVMRVTDIFWMTLVVWSLFLKRDSLTSLAALEYDVTGEDWTWSGTAERWKPVTWKEIHIRLVEWSFQADQILVLPLQPPVPRIVGKHEHDAQLLVRNFVILCHVGFHTIKRYVEKFVEVNWLLGPITLTYMT